ncbi:MAG: hypothetical protein KGD65_10515 [Candidatus Lokiarchaeota archaeon]|nr:hypothetical protein [Candidatus Lokiarchaeota archaeon]
MIQIQMMDKSNILSRCLHNDPVSIDKMDIPVFNSKITKGAVKEFLTKICDLYDSCAVLVYDNEKIVGLLRFYPQVVLDILDDKSGFRLDNVCIQQERFMKNILKLLDKFPSKEFLPNKIIEIECLQVLSHYHKGEAEDY